MALKLYRRHRKECEGDQPEDYRSADIEEGRRGWKRCACLIHASGTLGQKFSRKNTGQTDWQKARAVVALWESAGSWDGVQVSVSPAPVPGPDTARVTIARAIEAFTKETTQNLATNTQWGYGLLLRRLKAFADGKGYVMLDQLGPIDLREFRDSWGVGPQTSVKTMSSVKAFFEFAVSNEWLERNPARLVKNSRGRDAADQRSDQKLPFTDDELKRMYDAAATQYGKQTVQWSREIHHRRVEGEYARYNYKWTGQDLADFISVSVYTGLRISDVCTFRADRMKSTGEIQVRTTKSGTHVYTWVPEWLQERVRIRAQQFGPYIFGEHQTKDLNVVTDVWRRKLNKLWTLCGSWKERPHPHRFRHTFARILLNRPGVEVRDVAELLGNTEQMVRKHYAAWIPERQERLTALLKAAFNGSPKPSMAELAGAATE
jgi:integrase